MTKPTYDQGFWEALWAKTLREHPDKVAQRPPNARLVSELEGATPGRALDAGCGHGAESLWLAARGWKVTALDFSARALAQGRSMADAAGEDISGAIEWVEGDLGAWTPVPAHFDLVVCLYVHVAGSVEAMVQRLAGGVAPGGTLFMLGHRPVDPETGQETPAAGQRQVSVESALAALDPEAWEILIAEEHPRFVSGSGVDAVIHARRRS